MIIRQMSDSDFWFAQEVRAISGWNQTDQDWVRMLAYGADGCFVAEWEGHSAGTAITVCYGDVVGWIGMVLVHPDFRRRGIATALLNHCIAYLRSTVRCIKLDATPEGKLVYDRLGFVEEYELARWERTRPVNGSDTVAEPFQADDWPALLWTDAVAFGTDRERWLRGLSQNSRSLAVSRDGAGKVNGYGMSRAGERAEYLGPVVAVHPGDGEAITRKLLGAIDQETVYWDIPEDNKDAVALAESAGFVRQRPFIRMWLGEGRVDSQPEKQWAIADPATG